MPRAVLPVLLSLVLLAGCQSTDWIHAHGQGDPLLGSIQDIAGQRAVDERTLLAELERADFVLLGGAHDNLDHHRLQARLVEALGRGGGTTLAAVAFETIETDQQTVLVEQLDRGNVAALGQVLHWEQPGGRPALVDYRPILQAAQDAGAEIVAAGLPMATVTAVLSEGPGALPPSFAQRTGLLQPLPPLLAAELDQKIAAAHCGELAPGLVARMADAQRARDASLADRLVTLTGHGQGVLIAGPQHVRKDWGVPWYIERLRPDARTVSIALVEVGRAAEMEVEGSAWDYVWFTTAAGPPQPEGCQDPTGFIEQLEVRRPPTAGPVRRHS